MLRVELSSRTSDKELWHDFLKERRWLTVLAGFSDSSSILYGLYRFLIFVSIISLNGMAISACFIEPSKELIVRAAHFLAVGAYFAFWSLFFRLVLHRSVDDTRALLNTGVYRYEDEEQDKTILKIRKSMAVEVRRKSNVFILVLLISGFSSTTVLPAVQVVLDPNHRSGFENPYLFLEIIGTKDLMKSAIAWGVGNVVMYFIYTINCALFWYYISCVVQIKMHYRILNHSVRNIPKRALQLYTKKTSLPKTNSDELLDDADFQNCLYLSFRSNVEHHQALLRLKKYFEPFSGSIALCVFILAPIVYGCLFYLLYQKNSMIVTLNFCLMFAGEQFTVIFICFLGEDILAESEQLFSILYSTDWFNYNKRFKQVLHIMMSNTIKPHGVKALLLGVPASFETYGEVMSAMYKVTNLVKQSDIV